MAKIILAVLLLAATVYIVSSAKTTTGPLKATCQKTPPSTAKFHPDKNCKNHKKFNGVQCCCLCNGKNDGTPPGPGAGYYCNRAYCNGGKTTTAKPPPPRPTTTKPGATTTAAATTTTAAGSTSTTAGATSTTTAGTTSTTTAGSTSTTTGSTSTSTTTTTTTTASG
ncbi:unnamed protein product [Allacma fusca]|uniref:Integumentary mucin C.1-like n=1 Tax=Allacma fusca TaxID=39272 RepID=A0A8J2L9D1_9HEXA|nr:unnamed protein product [Allacma fusca]